MRILTAAAGVSLVLGVVENGIETVMISNNEHDRLIGTRVGWKVWLSLLLSALSSV